MPEDSSAAAAPRAVERDASVEVVTAGLYTQFHDNKDHISHSQSEAEPSLATFTNNPEVYDNPPRTQGPLDSPVSTPSPLEAPLSLPDVERSIQAESESSDVDDDDGWGTATASPIVPRRSPNGFPKSIPSTNYPALYTASLPLVTAKLIDPNAIGNLALEVVNGEISAEYLADALFDLSRGIVIHPVKPSLTLQEPSMVDRLHSLQGVVETTLGRVGELEKRMAALQARLVEEDDHMD